LDRDQFIGDFFKVGNVIFGTASQGYAFKPSESANLIYIRNSGTVASATFPGGNWVGRSVALRGAAYHMYWRNSGTQNYARWILNANGDLQSAGDLTRDQFFAEEVLAGADLDRDGRIGR
jgi:hypothetical protein